MRELEPEYEGRVEFIVVPAEETAQLGHEIEQLELGSHGLVATAADGEVRHTIPGHEFGREEIVAAIGKVLN